MKDYPDNELTYYLKDNSEEARDILYAKYKYIIDVILSKYKRVFLALNIELEEVRQEANLAFSNALYSYEPGKSATLSTFISLVVERKVRTVIKKYETNKNKALNDTISLDNTLFDNPMESIIGNDKYEPLKQLEAKDTIKYINNEVKNILSPKELEVYKLMIRGNDYVEIAKILNKTPKQIDNAIQRIRNKIKKIKEY